jgi:hypothetical protein
MRDIFAKNILVFDAATDACCMPRGYIDYGQFIDGAAGAPRATRRQVAPVQKD